MCKMDECERKLRKGRDVCERHYRQSIAKPCTIAGCSDRVVGKGLCSMHWQRKKAGIPFDWVKETGKTYVSSNGYVVEYILGHQQADKDGKLLQHRRVMSDALGRRLESYENVHHKNGNRQDNRIDNLELWITRQPAGQRTEDLISYAHWILEQYE